MQQAMVLTADQMVAARALGLTPTEYARAVMTLRKNLEVAVKSRTKSRPPGGPVVMDEGDFTLEEIALGEKMIAGER